MKVNVITEFNCDEIRQRTVFDTDAPSHISTEIINLKEQGIRQALIKLGWTPPAESKMNIPMHGNNEDGKQGKKVEKKDKTNEQKLVGALSKTKWTPLNHGEEK